MTYGILSSTDEEREKNVIKIIRDLVQVSLQYPQWWQAVCNGINAIQRLVHMPLPPIVASISFAYNTLIYISIIAIRG